jgi:hypothetical protein
MRNDPPRGCTTPAFRAARFASLLVVTALCLGLAENVPAAAPAVGDSYVYRIINGYSKEVVGQISYRVESTGNDRVVVAVSTERAGRQSQTTESYAPDGNWLRHALSNHDQPVDYEFTPAYPAYVFPLESGKSWSTRVNAVNPANKMQYSVRVDASVRGTERIKVAAGEFDTIKILRSIYAGDADYSLSETTIVETEWFAPSLGRSVRLNSTSAWLDKTAPPRLQGTRGDWDIYELVSAPPAR